MSLLGLASMQCRGVVLGLLSVQGTVEWAHSVLVVQQRLPAAAVVSDVVDLDLQACGLSQLDPRPFLSLRTLK